MPDSPYSAMGIAMVSEDGIWHRCHPILASFVGDYPEQVLVTCTYYGHCPKCLAPWDQLGEHTHFSSQDHNDTIKAYFLADGDIHTFHVACRDAGLKLVFHPFWESFPLMDIFLLITLDILHQLL
jgi:hypothetical protein